MNFLALNDYRASSPRARCFPSKWLIIKAAGPFGVSLHRKTDPQVTGETIQQELRYILAAQHRRGHPPHRENAAGRGPAGDARGLF